MEDKSVYPNQCKVLAGSIDKLNYWKLINESNQSDGIQIQFNSGETCMQNGTKTYYTTKFIIKCSPNAELNKIQLTSYNNFGDDQCEKRVEFISKEACPLINFYSIWAFAQTYKIFVGLFFIAIGIFLAVFGNKFLIVTFLITTALATVTFLCIVLFAIFIKEGTSIYVVWILLILSTIIGLIVGFLMIKIMKVTLGFILGGYTGYMLGLFLYNMIFIQINSNPGLVYWLVLISSIILCCVLAYFLIDHVIIVSTSFIGSYAIIRGVSLYANGFPNEFYIMDLIKKGETEELKMALRPVVYAYLSCWIILTGLGIFIQYKFRATEEEKDSKINLNTELNSSINMGSESHS
jgi:hypothetical protein